MAEDDTKDRVWVNVNPLLFRSLDPMFAAAEGTTRGSSAEAFLRDLLRDPVGDALRRVLRRYDETSRLDELLFAVPGHDVIQEKIVSPLRSAKQAYMLGDNLGCIALSGSVAEMVASLMFQIIRPRIGDAPMTPVLEKSLFGSAFERLSQFRRVRILQALGVWKAEDVKKADELAQIRNKHLHRLSADVKNIGEEALRAYRLALELAAGAVSLRVGDQGKIVIDQKLRRYLQGERPGASGTEGG